MLSEVFLPALLVPLTAAIVEIRHRRSADVILLRLEAPGLRRAELAGTLLRGADLTASDLTEADLTGANFREASLDGADLSRVRAVGAVFRQASLAGARLREADLSGADLSGADLRGADLRGAQHLDTATLEGALYDAATRWEPGFDPEARGAVLQDAG